MFFSILSSILAWFVEKIIGKLFGFGKSTDEKLGIAEAQVNQQADTIKETQNAQNIAAYYNGMSVDQLRQLTGKWKRND